MNLYLSDLKLNIYFLLDPDRVMGNDVINKSGKKLASCGTKLRKLFIENMYPDTGQLIDIKGKFIFLIDFRFDYYK
jgi:hypothetical protein